MTPADAEYLKGVREKIAGYPRLAREALRRREHDKAEEYWRLCEAIDELLRHFGAAPGNGDCSYGDP
jgi:predicted translin family RNA/ssDNA-binding protein